MDFHTLSRRELQYLCKKNKIPANMTNVAMADALQSLQAVEGISEIQEALLQHQSPNKLDVVSPAPPKTGRRTGARTTSRTVGPAKDEEKQASPLPRSRRVTARPSEIMMNNLVDADEKEEEGEMKKDVAETPKVPNTRRRVTKKEVGAVEVPTANTRTGWARASAQPVGVTTGRRSTRQSSKKEVTAIMGTDLLSGGLRRSTRVRGAAVKMQSLTNEEEKQEKEIEEEKVVEIETGTKEEEVKETTEECEQEQQNLKADDETIRELLKDDEDALAGLEDSPIRGLISTGQAPHIEVVHQDSLNPSTDIREAVSSKEEVKENLTEVSIGSEIAAKSPAKIEEYDDSSTKSPLKESIDAVIEESIDSETTVESPEEIEESEDSSIKSPLKESIDAVSEESIDSEVTIKEIEESEDFCTKSQLKESINAAIEESIDSEVKSSPQKESVSNLEIPIAIVQICPDPTGEISSETKGSTVDLVNDNGEESVEIAVEVDESGNDSEVTIKEVEESEDSCTKSQLKESINATIEESIDSEVKESSPQKESVDSSPVPSSNLEIPIASVQISPDPTRELPSEIKGSTVDLLNDNGQESVEIAVEVDESGNDLIAGEISVEAIKEEEEEVETEIVGELIAELSDLYLGEEEDKNESAGNESLVAGIYTGEDESNKKENGGCLTALTLIEMGPMGVEKKSYDEMSLRKLKAAYKNTLLTINKGEEKRAALKPIDDNCY